MRSTNKKMDSKNLHAKNQYFGINVKISKINAKMEYKYRKMEYNSEHNQIMGRIKKNKNAENTKVKI